MSHPRVSIAIPPGERACGGKGVHEWVYARDASGAAPFLGDVQYLRGRFPSDESRALYMQQVRERMHLASEGQLPVDWVTQMQIAPDVLRIKMPDHYFSGGLMLVRLYYSEPRHLPGHLVALRLRTKRPGPLGLDEQDRHAIEASDLLLNFSDRDFS